MNGGLKYLYLTEDCMAISGSLLCRGTKKLVLDWLIQKQQPVKKC